MKKSWISPDLLQKLKGSTNIIEVIGEHVVLRKSGSNYSGLCPFHSERTPSFCVSEQKQLYHCYGCKKGGDIIAFLTEMQGLSFAEAVEDLAERGKVKLPDEFKRQIADELPNLGQQNQAREKEALAYKLNRFVASYYHQNLGQNHSGTDYLRRRGVDYSLIQRFYVGSATDSWDALSEHLVARKAPEDLAQQLGLIRRSQKPIKQGSESGYFDLFRNRIMFPILNMRGKIAGYGGRSLGDETPKYLNSPESFVFQKSKLAFGLYQAQKFIRELDLLVLVEGYFDVLGMHRMGFQNVVATCGTALSRDHLHLFQRFANKIVLLFDGDRAGTLATERAMEVGLEQGVILYSAQLPENKDPDEIFFEPETGNIRPSGKEEMELILKNARAVLDTKIDEALQVAARSPEDRAQALKKIAHWLEKLKDPIGREVRLQWIQEKLGVSRQFIQDVFGVNSGASFQTGSLGSAPSDSRRPSRVSKPVKKSPLESLNTADRILLSGIILGSPYQDAFLKAKSDLPVGMDLIDLIEFPPAKQWIRAALAAPGGWEKLVSNPKQVLEDSLSEVESPQLLHSLISEVLLVDSPPFTIQDYQIGVKRRVSRLWAQFSQQIKKAIAQADKKMDLELYTKLMKEYLDVQRKMKEFICFYDQT